MSAADGSTKEKRTRVFALTLVAMIAFAANSLLCRFALRHTTVDAASFTFVRLFSGAAVLALLIVTRRSSMGGNWISALALFGYAAAFSFAYNSLSAGTGALLLFGAVQATMILSGIRNGERLGVVQLCALLLALGGLVMLVLPGIAAPPIGGSALMLTAGVAWGAYSLRAKRSGDPIAATAGNFLRGVVLAAALSLTQLPRMQLDAAGLLYGVVSGAVASGLGYVIWYTVVPSLTAVSAATVQLSVPVIAAAGGMLLLDEPLTMRFLLASIAVLGGIAIIVTTRTSRG